MSSHKLTFRYICDEAAIILLLLINRLLLLRYVLIVGHQLIGPILFGQLLIHFE